MFYVDKDKVLAAVKRMQREHCAYDTMSIGFPETHMAPPLICDCKYGYVGKQAHGEQTGCPELRCVIELLTNIRAGEYDEIMRRHYAVDAEEEEHGHRI